MGIFSLTLDNNQNIIKIYKLFNFVNKQIIQRNRYVPFQFEVRKDPQRDGTGSA